MSQGDVESHERAPTGPSDERVAGAAEASDDAHWMGFALEQAHLARAADEVPIGAVVVLAGQVIARGYNQTRGGMDPTAHAEMVAIAAAARTVQANRLVGATVYTTVEPCFMCAGALLHARVTTRREAVCRGVVLMGHPLGAVVAHAQQPARLDGHLLHRARLRVIHRRRLLAQNMLARPQ